MHGTGQTTKSRPDHREPQADEKRQKVFCDITREHPAEYKSAQLSVSRDVVFTLQKRLFEETALSGCI